MLARTQGGEQSPELAEEVWRLAREAVSADAAQVPREAVGRLSERMEDAVCEYCGRPIAGLPFRCNYCGGTFCAEHHLPPNHNCPNLSSWAARPPPGVTMRYERAAIFSVDVPEGGATLPAATGWQRGWKSYGAESYSPSATPTQPAAEHGGRPRTWGARA